MGTKNTCLMTIHIGYTIFTYRQTEETGLAAHGYFKIRNMLLTVAIVHIDSMITFDRIHKVDSVKLMQFGARDDLTSERNPNLIAQISSNFRTNEHTVRIRKSGPARRCWFSQQIYYTRICGIYAGFRASVSLQGFTSYEVNLAAVLSKSTFGFPECFLVAAGRELSKNVHQPYEHKVEENGDKKNNADEENLEHDPQKEKKQGEEDDEKHEDQRHIDYENDQNVGEVGNEEEDEDRGADNNEEFADEQDDGGESDEVVDDGDVNDEDIGGEEGDSDAGSDASDFDENGGDGEEGDSDAGSDASDFDENGGDGEELFEEQAESDDENDQDVGEVGNEEEDEDGGADNNEEFADEQDDGGESDEVVDDGDVNDEDIGGEEGDSDAGSDASDFDENGGDGEELFEEQAESDMELDGHDAGKLIPSVVPDECKIYLNTLTNSEIVDSGESSLDSASDLPVVLPEFSTIVNNEYDDSTLGKDDMASELFEESMDEGDKRDESSEDHYVDLPGEEDVQQYKGVNTDETNHEFADPMNEEFDSNLGCWKFPKELPEEDESDRLLDQAVAATYRERKSGLEVGFRLGKAAESAPNETQLESESETMQSAEGEGQGEYTLGTGE
ncbi:hypothetical protein CLF_108368, partial [Clonorchis sinensis]